MLALCLPAQKRHLMLPLPNIQNIHSSSPGTHVIIYKRQYLHRNPPSTPPTPSLPSPQPQRTPNPHTHRHRPESRSITLPPITKHIILRLLSQPTSTLTIRSPLINTTIHDSPVRAEIFDAPDYGYNEGSKGEQSTVTGSDKRGDEPESLGVVLNKAGCEDDLA